eukprot:5631832-Pyramimonas_sp.AAC.1
MRQPPSPESGGGPRSSTPVPGSKSSSLTSSVVVGEAGRTAGVVGAAVDAAAPEEGAAAPAVGGS